MSSWTTSSRMLAIGEVRTGLLRGSLAASRETTRTLLNVMPGEQVRVSQRPSPYAVSPTLLTGVDCPLPSASGSRTRGIGTVASHAIISGGRILQGSAFAVIAAGKQGFRLPWSYYLAQPAVIETISRFNWDDLVEAFLVADPNQSALNIGAISEYIMNRVQRSPLLGGPPPFRAPRTMFQWTIEADPSRQSGNKANFRIVDRESRTLRLATGGLSLDSLIGLCEDLALHDWLLCALVDLIDRSLIGSGEPSSEISCLRSAVDHILHLWMPGARLDSELLLLWRKLDEKPGITRQWEGAVNRLRDNLTLSMLAVMSVATKGRAEEHEPSRRA